MNAAESRWGDLLALALPALDHVFGQPVAAAPAPWTLGGGTALALRIDHRISHDIDLFVPGVPLKLFMPHANPKAALIASRYQYPGHYLKFERPDGEIDFLSPPLQTTPGYGWHPFRQRLIAVETLEEVIVKKIRFRSARFAARDAYDLAAVAEIRPDLAHILTAEVPDALERVRESIDRLIGRGREVLEHAVVITPGREALRSACYEIARQTIEAAIEQRDAAA